MTPNLPGRRIARFLAAAGVAGALAGCFSPKPDVARHFVLDPLPASAAPAVALDPSLALGVFEADVPAYLDRPQMVTRQPGGQVSLNEFERWGEPLGTGFSRVLAQDIALDSGSSRVAEFPLPQAFGQEFEVYVEVLEFDGAPAGNVTLRALWRVTGPGGHPEYYLKDSTFTRRAAAGADETRDYVATLDDLVGDLASEIVQSLPLVRANKASAGATAAP
jgi:uncharacterized protein